jgi:hypothetical protein
MTKYLTSDAGAVAERACDHAIRLGHPYFGGERAAVLNRGRPAN